MLDMHHAEYAHDTKLLKSIYRTEIPHNSIESVQAVLSQIHATRIPILVILGETDPWNDRTFSMDDLPSHVTAVQMNNTGHYPQISKPVDLAKLL
ncbi:hypothetical protein COU75_00725 [Candidatus Peregrinibacteria bacterium CG10_big_fil_rev_8_21_14_0_10_42_8]|nr:MAG: hypothetical protein COU75_00725 [Candidatus Peregrinibacteria bacterium CG10_big_fil_rev_8_21_14_0_10_42_8]